MSHSKQSPTIAAFLGLAICATVVLLQSSDARAAGKKQVTPADPGTGLVTPNPVRPVTLAQLTTQPFQLPNGSTVDLAADIGTIFITAVTGSTKFAPTDGAQASDDCDMHIEIRGGLSTLDLNAGSGSIHFGYTPSGSTATVGDMTGELTVTVGTLAMDFSVWQCVGGKCSAVAAATASQVNVGAGLTFNMNLNSVTTGTSLLYNTPLGGIIRKIMDKALAELSASARLSELSWFAQVLEYNATSGQFFFDAGTEKRINTNEAFAVYALDAGQSICSVYKPIAYAHTTRVDARSSVGLIDQTLEERPIQKGDLVFVRQVKTAASADTNPRFNSIGRMASAD